MASSLLALVIVGVFGTLLFEIKTLEQNRSVSRKARAVLDASLAVDADMGELAASSRGFLITHSSKFLDQLHTAQVKYTADTKDLLKTTGAFKPKDLPRTQNLVSRLSAYNKSLDQLYGASKEDLRELRDRLTERQATKRLENARFDLVLISNQLKKFTASKRSAITQNTDDALLIALVGVILSIAMIVLYTFFIRRYVVAPIRATADAAEQIADGDLTARSPETGSGETKMLNIAFNRMAESLQSSRDEYRELVGRLPAITYAAELGPDTPWIFVSPQIESMLGYKPDEWLNDPQIWIDAIHPDDRDRVLEAFRADQREEETILCDYRMYSRSGELGWYRDEGRIERTDNGVPLFHGIILDITRLKALEQERERFWSTSLELLAVCDFEGRFTRLNPIWEQTLGFSVEELCSKPSFEFVHPDDIEPTMAAASRLFDDGLDVLQFENRYLCKDGSYRWLQWSSTVDMDLELSFGVARDITDQKNLERVQAAQFAVSRALAVSSSKEEAIENLLPALGNELENTNAAYWEPTETGELRSVATWRHPTRGSSEFEQATKKTLLSTDGHLLGKAWREGKPVFIEDISRAELQREGAALSAGLHSAFAFPIITGKQRYGVFELFVDGTNRYDNDVLLTFGTTASMIGQFFDRKVVEQETERLKDEFFALISHELRTPLTSIIGYLELARESSNLTGEVNEFLSVIQRNADRLLRLVGDILFAAQFEAGTLNLNLGEVDLVQAASNAISVAKPRANSSEISLNLNNDHPTELVCRADGDRIGQLLDNLVSNAVKFTPPNGEVTVSVDRTNGNATLVVADSGKGIPHDEQDRLFERFFRSTDAVKDAIPGVGLGLTITKGIVEAHGGSISVQSDPENGTKFKVELPLEGPSQ